MQYVIKIHEMDGSRLEIVGGKGFNLGQLSRRKDINVPEGFCVSTQAYRESVEANIELTQLIDTISGLSMDDLQQIPELCSRIRSRIENLSLPEDIKREISRELSGFKENQVFAIRSSATTGDLPEASFAGQQDTYLNIRGKKEIFHAIVKCWASLYSERASIYRIQNGICNHAVQIAVVIQKMIPSEASGILFTADPITSDRKTMSIDAGFGLGEALVSGLVNPDTYKVRDGKILSKGIGNKRIVIKPKTDGGTEKSEVEACEQNKQVLSDEQILQLYTLGKKIEAHFGQPQDVEWCLADQEFHIVQSRPISTLFPIPAGRDGKKRVFLSSAHLQVMTEPILPLGMSIFELSSLYPLDQAGGRLFIDITNNLTTLQGRRMLLNKAEMMDPLMANIIKTLLKQKEFIKTLPGGKGIPIAGKNLPQRLIKAIRVLRKNDPTLFDTMINEQKEKLDKLEKELGEKSGPELFQSIWNDKVGLLDDLFHPTWFGMILACMFASDWLNKKIEMWLGEKNVADILSKSVDRNITSQMGIALYDVADVIRKYPEIQEHFIQISNTHGRSDLFKDLIRYKGGPETIAAMKEFLDKHGMRCTAEIDITKPRWHEDPTQLIGLILNDIKMRKPGEHIKKFGEGKADAKTKEEEIFNRISQLPGGSRNAKKVKKRIEVFRNFLGAREYPKYFLVCRYAIYKCALMKEADRLLEAGVLRDRDDVFYLFMEEFQELVETKHIDYSMIQRRKKEYRHYEKLTPPRIILSDGEVPIIEKVRNSIPEGALIGIPVSPGIIEGRARVMENLQDGEVGQGDILVTAFTDPSWTPVFVLISGLVTEVGGAMSHGAVITREYGLPAVVGVDRATKLIKDGQRIRLNGMEGYVEVLD